MKNNQSQNKIPDGWRLSRIKDFAPLQRGFDLPVSLIHKGKYPVVFSNGVLKFHYTYKVKGPGVVTGRSGTIGKVHYIEDNYWPHNTSLWVTDFKDNSPKFIFYFYKRFNLSRYGAGSGVPTLNRNDVHIQKVLIPILSEQNRIVVVLETWDKTIEKLEKKIKIKKKIKKGLMQRLLTGKIRLSGYTKKWRETSLRDIAEIILSNVDKHIKKGEKEVFLCNYMDVYYKDLISASAGLSKGTVGENEYDKFVLRKGDVLITKDSETPEDIARSCVVQKDFDDIVCGYHIAIIRGKRDLINGFFLKKFFDLPLTQNYFFRLANGATRFGLGKSSIEKALITIPSLEEQIAIANILNAADEEIISLQKKLSFFNEQKKFLLHNLITGVIRTPENLKIN